jgi:hypothetical protein
LPGHTQGRTALHGALRLDGWRNREAEGTMSECITSGAWLNAINTKCMQATSRHSRGLFSWQQRRPCCQREGPERCETLCVAPPSPACMLAEPLAQPLHAAPPAALVHAQYERGGLNTCAAPPRHCRCTAKRESLRSGVPSATSSGSDGGGSGGSQRTAPGISPVLGVVWWPLVSGSPLGNLAGAGGACATGLVSAVASCRGAAEGQRSAAHCAGAAGAPTTGAGGGQRALLGHYLARTLRLPSTKSAVKLAGRSAGRVATQISPLCSLQLSPMSGTPPDSTDGRSCPATALSCSAELPGRLTGVVAALPMQAARWTGRAGPFCRAAAADARVRWLSAAVSSKGATTSAPR